MSIRPAIAAAQYLRVSTERQEYSLDHQSQTIRSYADDHGFSVVQTYSDPAVSGVLLRRRKGLQKLIQDVVQRNAIYKVILVYDVSRWGRFQDCDESAYYEFLCKSAGVRVHYCAETFSNDECVPNMIMKSLKRVMAGEYSRELGIKVFAGQRRGATLGFRQGAEPGYGLRRFLVSAENVPKQQLGHGERKSLASDRVILVPGPSEEVRRVRQIYRMFLEKQMNYSDISRELRRLRVPYIDGSDWSMRAVQTILTHPKYMGVNVYGRYSQRLYTPPQPKPRSEWILTPGAFEPVVDPKLFTKVQETIMHLNSTRPRSKSDEDLLNALRAVRARHGKITEYLIARTPGMASANSYRARFGSLSRAYQLIGYSGYWDDTWRETNKRIQRMRNELMNRIVELDPTRISIEKREGGYRNRLRLHDGRLVSVLVSRPVKLDKKFYWLLAPREEYRLPALVARLNFAFDAFKDMFVIPPLGRRALFYMKESDERLHRQGQRLTDLGEFFRVTCQV
ncbi:MAG TPA: recombinase family protein [Candidatus Sulfotelmatobacter sp.]|nr:recombinase family protein [Candidatus Sulfotelmatobacter sp.]